MLVAYIQCVYCYTGDSDDGDTKQIEEWRQKCKRWERERKVFESIMYKSEWKTENELNVKSEWLRKQQRDLERKKIWTVVSTGSMTPPSHPNHPETPLSPLPLPYLTTNIHTHVARKAFNILIRLCVMPHASANECTTPYYIGCDRVSYNPSGPQSMVWVALILTRTDGASTKQQSSEATGGDWEFPIGQAMLWYIESTSKKTPLSSSSMAFRRGDSGRSAMFFPLLIPRLCYLHPTHKHTAAWTRLSYIYIYMQ